MTINQNAKVKLKVKIMNICISSLLWMRLTTLALTIFGLSYANCANANETLPEILSASYGPPANANVWERFSISLTAENFGVDESTFAEVMKHISLFRIRTEMHTGEDYGGVDNVKIGARLASFDSGTDGWNAMGDGTLSWESTGGASGGYIKISDWASGDWHWASAPDVWQGGWSNLIGENLEFYFKTNYPSYGAVSNVSLTSSAFS